MKAYSKPPRRYCSTVAWFLSSEGGGGVLHVALRVLTAEENGFSIMLSGTPSQTRSQQHSEQPLDVCPAETLMVAVLF